MLDLLKSIALCIAAFAAYANAAPIKRHKPKPPVVTYTIDASRSKFMVIAPRGGPAYFKGHSHYLAVREFGGTIELTPDVVSPASLTMSIKSASIEETGADFTDAQKKDN